MNHHYTGTGKKSNADRKADRKGREQRAKRAQEKRNRSKYSGMPATRVSLRYAPEPWPFPALIPAMLLLGLTPNRIQESRIGSSDF